MAKYTIEHDNHPDEVADTVSGAASEFGLETKIIDSNDGYIEYEMIEGPRAIAFKNEYAKSVALALFHYTQTACDWSLIQSDDDLYSNFLIWLEEKSKPKVEFKVEEYAKIAEDMLPGYDHYICNEDKNCVMICNDLDADYISIPFSFIER